MNSEIMVITPEMASEWLKNNPNNRPINMRDVTAMINTIKAGRFVLTHQGIAFDEDGRLIDGQHRLTAIALAGIPVTMMVSTNVPRQNMTAVDAGRGRNKVDRDTIIGKYADCPVLRSTNVNGMVRTLILIGGHRAGSRISDWEIDAIIEKYDHIIVPLAKKMRDAPGANAAINAAALAAAIAGESISAIGKFYDVFLRGNATDCEEYNSSAAFNLFRIFSTAKLKGMTVGRERTYNLAQSAIWLFINSHEPVSFIRETKKERYPVEDKIKKAIEEVKK